MKNSVKIAFVAVLLLPLALGACSMNNGQGVRPTASILIGK